MKSGFLSLLIFALLAGAWVQLYAVDFDPLKSVAEIRAVKGWRDVDRHPISIEGVVTAIDTSRNLLVLQDATGAIALDIGDSKLDVAPGQSVSVVALDSWPPIPDLPRYPQQPDRREFLKSFECIPPKQSGFYIARYRGYLYPPTTGDYRFAIASDDASQLLIGTDSTPESRRGIAAVRSYTRQRDWNRTSSQRSGSIFLEAGRAYYIEAVHQQAGGLTHLSVAWEGPGLPLDIIPGDYLSPWPADQIPDNATALSPPAISPRRGTLLREVWEDVTVDSPEIVLTPRKLGNVLSLRSPKISVHGPGRLPEPVVMHPGQEISSEDDFRWGAIEGTADFVGRDGDRLTLEISDRGQSVRATISGWHGESLSNIRGRRVRIVGAVESVWQPGDKRRVGRVWSRAANAITLTGEVPQSDLARLITISELTQSDPLVVRDAAVKFVGRVASRSGTQLKISDSGTISAFVSEDGLKWRMVGRPIEISMGTTVYVGLVANSRQPAKSSHAVFTNIAGLPHSPLSTDIGSPATAGQLVVSEGQYVVNGVGSDIWDAPDQFTFVYKPLEGEGSIVARLQSFDPADPAARAGLMIRESLDPEAQFVDLVQTVEAGGPLISMQWRRQASGNSTRSIDDTGPTILHAWLKLERQFNTITVNCDEAEKFNLGENVDVVGYVTVAGKQTAITNASVNKQLQDTANAQPQLNWRPLVEIARLNDGNLKWGGLDFFRFRGVVTFCGDVLGRRYWAIQDQSAATLLTGRDASNLFSVRPGSYVEVVSNPGWARPTDTLFADNVFRLGSAAFPSPVRHPAEYLLPKRGEGTWVELEGIVRSVNDTGLMEVKARGEVFTVAVSGEVAARLHGQIDAGVRLRGVIVYPTEKERMLLVPSPEHLEVTKSPIADPFSMPLRSSRSLTVENLLNQSWHRIRLRGTVIYADQALVYVQDESGGLRVELEAAVPVGIGSEVEIVGFPDWGENESLVMRHAQIQVKATGLRVNPTTVSAFDAAHGRLANQLIRVRGTVSRAPGAGDGDPLEIEVDHRVFRVSLHGRGVSPGQIPSGSVVELTGVNVREAGLVQWMNLPDAASSILPLKLLLRSSEDIAIVQKPSWWVVKRAMLVIGFISFVAVIAIVWIHTLRQRVKQRTAELAATMKKLENEARVSATLLERDRLAGEIHDSLEQGLNGLMLQLESTAGLESCPPEIRSSLALACSMASFSRTEVQNAVWELQSPILEDSELPLAIEKIMRQICPESLQGIVKVDGVQRRLASTIEHHLLRIAQEAMNNAIKHSKAHNLIVTLSYEDKAVVLSVTDDGCGFQPDRVVTGGPGHFGLRSLRSRVAKIHATHEVLSSPGKGTTILVRVPISNK